MLKSVATFQLELSVQLLTLNIGRNQAINPHSMKTVKNESLEMGLLDPNLWVERTSSKTVCENWPRRCSAGTYRTFFDISIREF